MGRHCGCAVLPQCILQNGNTPIDITTYSVYCQARWNIVERLELAGVCAGRMRKRVESRSTCSVDSPTMWPTRSCTQAALSGSHSDYTGDG